MYVPGVPNREALYRTTEALTTSPLEIAESESVEYAGSTLRERERDRIIRIDTLRCNPARTPDTVSRRLRLSSSASDETPKPRYPCLKPPQSTASPRHRFAVLAASARNTATRHQPRVWDERTKEGANSPFRVASSSSSVLMALLGIWTYRTTEPRMKQFLTAICPHPVRDISTSSLTNSREGCGPCEGVVLGPGP